MTEEKICIPAEFVPADRASEESLMRQAEYFTNLPPVCRIIDSIPDLLLVLNYHRQVIFSNKKNRLIPNHLHNSIIGKHPGEVFDCIHALTGIRGCGASEFCRTCGAAKAIINSNSGRTDYQECRIIQKSTGEALDLRIKTVPFEHEGESFTFFTVSDISDEKRRRALERIFYHDVLNTAGGIQGFAQLFKMSTPEEIEELKDVMLELSERLVEEIIAQKDLTAAENNELSPEIAPVDVKKFLNTMLNLYTNHKNAYGKTIRIKPGSSDVVINTDPVLLRRVVGNMIKNALEASYSDQVIELSSELMNDQVNISVHNPGVIPSDVQLQIFQRSFSTKGQDRGLGTYSMKLLTEKYLNGKAGFTSTIERGTVFTIQLPCFHEMETNESVIK